MGVSAKRLKTIPSRKQERKDKRKQKKLRKLDFFSKKRIPGQFVLNPDRNELSNNPNNNDCDKNTTDEKYSSNAKSKINKSSTNKSINVLDFLQVIDS